MSSLRSLLDTAVPESLPIQTYMGPGAHQLVFRGNHCWEFSDSYNYDWQRIRWCVPNRCICRVKFEIWGGGGGGSGTCCCSIAWSGHSGQYSACTVCAATQGVNQLDGCCYDLCVAGSTCRHPSRGGYDGCKSFVVGPGLDDFCACGGCHGFNCCAWIDDYFSCRTRINEIGPACCRLQPEHYSLGNPACICCCEQRGKFFWGNLNSYMHFDCSPGCGNWCVKKDYHPTAPMFGARYGVYHAFRRPEMHDCGRRSVLWHTGQNGGLSGDCFRNGPPGSGGVSSQVYGNGCCCGSEGAAGLIRVTLYCKS
jgi:hypothetical protein